MTTYSDHEQRMLDQQSGEEMDKHAHKKRVLHYQLEFARYARDEAWKMWRDLVEQYPPGKRTVEQFELTKRAFATAELKQIQYENALGWANYERETNGKGA